MMDDKLRQELDMLRKLKGEEKERRLLEFAETHTSPQAYNELGLYYRDEKKDNLRGAEMIKKALLIQKDASLYSNLAVCYFNLCREDTEQREEYMKKTVDAFQASANLNSASYYFLGNLYMPKVNQPFPDDYEKANSYFMKIEKEKGFFWAEGMKNIGLWYYHEKKDYLTASAYLLLAKNGNPKDKKIANYYEYSFGRVHGRKFWKIELDRIVDQNDVEHVIAEGKWKNTVRCPKCGSTKVTKVSTFDKMKKTLSGSFGLKRFERYALTYHCDSCKHEW